MTLPVYVHPRVQTFLDDNAQWWAEHHSAEQAEAWYDGFVEAIFSLEHHPEGRPLARENDAFPFKVRELYYGVGQKITHRALFTIRPDQVYVFLIRHVSQAPVSLDDIS